MKPEQCPSTTFDRLAGRDTRCREPEGHAGPHDDGALTWGDDDSEDRVERLYRRIAEVLGERATGGDIADLEAIVEDAARWRGLQGLGAEAHRHQ